MATTIYSAWGSTTGGSNFIRAYLTYTVTTTDTAVRIDWSAGTNVKTNYHTNAQITNTVSCTGQSDKSVTRDNQNWGGGNHQMTSGSYTYSRTTTASTKTIKSQIKAYGKSAVSVSYSFSVPALASYSVTYNANGGSGSIATQTKWFGQNLTLASGGFSRENHTLLGWATSSGATLPTYSFGSTYTNNASLNLYAVWHRNYTNPTINSASVFRTNSASGTSEADEGTYIRVAFTSTKGTDGSNSYTSSCIVTIDGVQKFSGTIGTSFAQNYGTYDINSPHTVTIRIYDSTDTTGTTYTYRVASATFPLDILADGSAMGVMHVAVAGKKLTLPATTIDGAITIGGQSHNGLVGNSVSGQDGTHQMGLSWNGSRGILGVDGHTFPLAHQSDIPTMSYESANSQTHNNTGWEFSAQIGSLQLRWGSFNIKPSAANKTTAKTIQFKTPFPTSCHQVQLTLGGAPEISTLIVSVYSQTNNGFEARIFANNTTDRIVRYFAIGN